MTAPSPRAALISRRVSALSCATHGTGTPLLLIHSFGGSGTLFQSLVPTLAERHSVIVPDLRGHGNSYSLPDADLAQMTTDLDDLLDLLRVPRCTVLGYGDGGLVAQQLAYAYPERVNKLILINAAAQSARTVRAQIERRLRASLARITGGDAGANLSTFDSRAWLARLGCPALVVASAGDPAAVQNARELAERLPNVQLRLTPGNADTCLRAHAPALLERILFWLNEREATR